MKSIFLGYRKEIDSMPILLALLLLASTGDELWMRRNLGKAFYENPTTQKEAVREFQRALELAPNSARERLNFGLALLRAGREPEGILELEKVQKQDPSLPHTWWNLGIQYARAGEAEKALPQFAKFVEMVPAEPAGLYNLGVLYRRTGDDAKAAALIEGAANLNTNLASPHYQLFNIYRKMGRAEDAARELKTFQALRERNTGAAVAEDLGWCFFSEIYDPAPAAPSDNGIEPVFKTVEIAKGFDGVAVAPLDAVEKPDLVMWSKAGVSVVLNNGKPAAVSGLKDVVSLTAADVDNDGVADLIAATQSEVVLVQKLGAPKKLMDGAFAKIVAVDYDHDYDLDLLLLGERNVLLRNSGAAGWVDRTEDFPFIQGAAVDGVAFDLMADTDSLDIVLAMKDGSGVLYRDKLAGRYEAIPLAKAGTGLKIGDFNQDGWTDVIGDGFVLRNDHGKLIYESAPAAAVAMDAGNSGRVRLREGLASATVADYDGDGKNDIIGVEKGGRVVMLHNETKTTNHAVTVSISGVKNLKTAQFSKLEVRAGGSYQKQTYLGVPVVFGLGAADKADAVRIQWANGLIQSEFKQPLAGKLVYKELPRLSGSCPMIFSWNGTEYEFITDVLGVAPLGASAGEDAFPVNHNESVLIPGSSLVERDGKLEIRITEELREVAYLDKLRLIAADHPAATAVVLNDKFKAPPFPEFKVWDVEKRVAAIHAVDQTGADVRERIARKDAVYADGFARSYDGTAEMHSVTLDFGVGAAADGKALLVLSGWVDWADGSTFRGASQSSKHGLGFPFLQVRDAGGNWVTVIEDMGIPAGKPKTIAVDLTDKFLSTSREVRIVTNLCVYWDEIYLSEGAAVSRTRLTELSPAEASLGFRGWSRAVIDAERQQPERFVYGEVQHYSTWNQTAGLYTKYGAVDALLNEADDCLMIMGSGDELRLTFDAAKLPPLAAGWERDYILFVDGWAKDADANTAFARTVEPLPYQGMSGYPSPENKSAKACMVDTQIRPALNVVRGLK